MSFTKAETYQQGNDHSRHNTKILMEEFYDWIDWRKDGQDSLLDVGTGPGNTIRDEIYHLLPKNFSRLVCSDISKLMVEQQKIVFKGYDRVSCEVLDITAEMSDEFSKRLGTFDHVTSFYCLMWVKEQQKAMDNIYKLIKPGGDCLLVIAVYSPIMEAILSVCEKPRWRDYFIGWQDLYVFPYRNIAEAKTKGLTFMKNAGFVETKAELREIKLQVKSDEQKESFLRSIPNKFSKKPSPEEEEEIFQERLQFLDRFNLGDYRDNTGRIDKSAITMILYGKKLK